MLTVTVQVASLQGYLLKNKTRPRECVEEVAEWVIQERETREKLKKEKAEVRIFRPWCFYVCGDEVLIGCAFTIARSKGEEGERGERKERGKSDLSCSLSQ